MLLLQVDATEQGGEVRIRQMHPLCASLNNGFDDRIDPF